MIEYTTYLAQKPNEDCSQTLASKSSSKMYSNMVWPRQPQLVEGAFKRGFLLFKSKYFYSSVFRQQHDFESLSWKEVWLYQAIQRLESRSLVSGTKPSEFCCSERVGQNDTAAAKVGQAMPTRAPFLDPQCLMWNGRRVRIPDLRLTVD